MPAGTAIRRGEKPARGRPGAGRATIVSPSRSPSRPRRLPEARKTARPIGPSSTIRVDVRRATALRGRGPAVAHQHAQPEQALAERLAPQRLAEEEVEEQIATSATDSAKPRPRTGMRNGAPTNTPSTARAIARRESYFERSSCGGAAAGASRRAGASDGGAENVVSDRRPRHRRDRSGNLNYSSSGQRPVRSKCSRAASSRSRSLRRRRR